MYEQILRDYRLRYVDFPLKPDIDLGLAIKHIRLRMGMTQDELATHAKMKPSALKTLENGYAKFTKTSTLQGIAAVLRLDLREVILEAREWFPANFFVSKLADPESKRKRKPKLRDETWFKRAPLTYDGFTVDWATPPITSLSHFCFAIIEIKPGRAVQNLKLPLPGQIYGFVQRGTLGITYDAGKETSVFGNQAFCLRGDKLHSLANKDKDNPLRLCLLFSLTEVDCQQMALPKRPSGNSFSVGRAINQIRHIYAHSAGRPLSFADLSELTGLEAKSLQYLEQTTKPEQVIYWDKIEKITQAIGMPFHRFYDLAEGKDEGYFYLATAHDRALIDYRHYLGVRIKSALFPGAINQFHLSEMYIEPRGGIRRSTWKRMDESMIVAYVDDGELLVEVGKNRKASLKQGESVYFDASLGYRFSNIGQSPIKLLVATYPPLIF